MKAPVILVTAMSSNEVEPKVRTFGVADILHKTQDLFQNLIPLVQRTLGDENGAKSVTDSSAGNTN